MVERTSFRSSNLDSGSYDPSTQVMTIDFQSGDSYVYENVPPDMWQALKSAPSPGQFFARFIRNSFSYSRA